VTAHRPCARERRAREREIERSIEKGMMEINRVSG